MVAKSEKSDAGAGVADGDDQVCILGFETYDGDFGEGNAVGSVGLECTGCTAEIGECGHFSDVMPWCFLLPRY